MKKLLLFTFLTCLTIQAQQFKSFNDAIEIGSNNNLKLHLSDHFRLKDEDCAEYYMITQFDKEIFSIKDSIHVFYTNDKLYIKGSYTNDKRNGTFTWYHKNGKIQTIGEYSMNERTGVWQFFNTKGNLYKKVEYKNNQEYLIDFYDQKGNQTVKDGNGFFKDEIPLVSSATVSILNKIEGAVVNGLPDGTWEIETLGRKTVKITTANSPNPTLKTQLVPMKMCTEYFSNGKFTKGISYSEVANIGDSFYYDNYWSRFTGLVFIEKLALARSAYCKSLLDGTNTMFYNRIKLDFNNSELKKSASNNWYLATLEMDDDKKIKSVDLYSAAPAETTNQLKKMIENTEIPKTKIRTLNTRLYFPFVIKDHEIYFPNDSEIELFKKPN